VVIPGDELAHIGNRAMTVNAALPVKKLFDQVRVGDDKSCIREPFQSVNATIYLGPLRKSLQR
jgi:hypothetical protein